MEGDFHSPTPLKDHCLFQSTPSVWRETPRVASIEIISDISIHSLRMEGDTRKIILHMINRTFQSTPSVWRETEDKRRCTECVHISIHSLRMEGDSLSISSVSAVSTFQSTPSVWRETSWGDGYDAASDISIHSLRMEGDCSRWLERAGMRLYFNPLPPYGGRLPAVVAVPEDSSFQSTPSVWRETSPRQVV